MTLLVPEDVARVQRWREVRKILAVRLDNMGDVLMTTPALSALRHSLPDAPISLLASPAAAGLADHLHDVDEVIPFSAPWMKSSPAAREPLVTLQIVEQLMQRNFDAAIIFTVCTQNPLPAAMLCMLANIPLRLAHCRENPYALLTDWIPDPDVISDGMRHEVTRQLALVAAVGMHTPRERLQFDFTAVDVVHMHQHMRSVGLDPDRPYFVVHPGASAPSRRYPVERFGAAARLVSDQSGCQAVFTGSEAEAELAQAGCAAMGAACASLAGRLSLGELGALIDGATVLISNNSGPVHIAAARGTPVVDLYAQTNPQHTPWHVACRVLHDDAPCRNCLKSVCPQSDHPCLRNVTPQRVAQAALELMGFSAAPSVSSLHVNQVSPRSLSSMAIVPTPMLSLPEAG